MGLAISSEVERIRDTFRLSKASAFCCFLKGAEMISGFVSCPYQTLSFLKSTISNTWKMCSLLRGNLWLKINW